MRCVGRAGHQLRAIHLEPDEARALNAVCLMVMGPGLTEGLELALKTAPISELDQLCRVQAVQFWWVQPEQLGVSKPAGIAAEDAGEGLSSRLAKVARGVHAA